MTTPSHPSVSLADNAFVATMTTMTENRNGDIRYLAQLVLDIYEPTKSDPAVVAVVNERATRALESSP